MAGTVIRVVNKVIPSGESKSYQSENAFLTNALQQRDDQYIRERLGEFILDQRP